MSKLAGAAPSMTPLTMYPGTVAYMPPEALDEPPVYTKKLDCFSEGVIMIQVCTRLWPEPGPRTKTTLFPGSPTGTIKVPVLEPERRKNHIDMIDRGHGLKVIAVDCLHYQENERPSSEELCQRLAGLKETREYRESVDQVERVQNDIAQLEGQMEEIQVREAATVQQLHQQYKSEINSKERQIQKLRQQLKEQEHLMAEIQQKPSERMRQQPSQQLQQNSLSQLPPPVPPRARVRSRQLQQAQSVKEKQSETSQQMRLQEPHAHKGQIKLGEWRDGGRAPYEMIRGATVVDVNEAYFVSLYGQTYSFDLSGKKWSNLPTCPYRCCSLAIVRGLLTAIGGNEGHTTVGKLVSIVSKRNKEWVEHFPPMPAKRSHTAAVTITHHLIVAGGESGSNLLDTVEVMDIQTLVWSIAASLPHPYVQASSTICGDRLYMLGGMDKDGTDYHYQSVFTCSVTKLLQSCSGTSSDPVWHRIADVPVYRSTCAAVNGELLAVGGEDEENGTTSAVYKYNPTTDSWNVISNMRTYRCDCLVAVLPTKEMMVVAGEIHVEEQTDIVEIASIQYV
jgi:hypothetical protein